MMSGEIRLPETRCGPLRVVSANVMSMCRGLRPWSLGQLEPASSAFERPLSADVLEWLVAARLL